MTDSAVRPFEVHVHPLRWLGQRDRGFAALRRASLQRLMFQLAN
jgi:hypothetical protein